MLPKHIFDARKSMPSRTVPPNSTHLEWVLLGVALVIILIVVFGW